MIFTVTQQEYQANTSLCFGLPCQGIAVNVEKEPGKTTIMVSAMGLGDDSCPCCDYAPPISGWACSYCLAHFDLADFKQHYLKCQEDFRKTFYQLVEFLERRELDNGCHTG